VAEIICYAINLGLERRLALAASYDNDYKKLQKNDKGFSDA